MPVFPHNQGIAAKTAIYKSYKQNKRLAAQRVSRSQ